MTREDKVQSRHVGKEMEAALKTIVCGEIMANTEMLAEAREMALKRTVEKAEDPGADTVINIRISNSAMVGGAPRCSSKEQRSG